MVRPPRKSHPQLRGYWVHKLHPPNLAKMLLNMPITHFWKNLPKFGPERGGQTTLKKSPIIERFWVHKLHTPNWTKMCLDMPITHFWKNFPRFGSENFGQKTPKDASIILLSGS